MPNPDSKGRENSFLRKKAGLCPCVCAYLVGEWGKFWRGEDESSQHHYRKPISTVGQKERRGSEMAVGADKRDTYSYQGEQLSMKR